MTRYCTMADVRSELDKDPATAAYTVDDIAINERIGRASAAINTRCQHSFDSAVLSNEVRRGEQVILAHDGVLEITASKANVQSLSSASITMDFVTWYTMDTTLVDIDQYVMRFYKVNVLIPVGRAVRMVAKLSYTGGYATLPDDIVQATARLTAFYFTKRRAPFDTTSFPATGQVTIPSDFPGDVERLLTAWIRKRP